MIPLKIYIVEDDAIIALSIQTALKKQGYTVCGNADTMELAKDEIKKRNPDLVLVDIQLDGTKDGIDLAENLDKEGVPYLYLTSQTDPHTILRVKQTKPIGYIVKPFTEHSLRSNIEIAWNNYRGSEEYLSFSANNELYKIKQSQILYLKAFDNYCYVVTADREYLVPKTFKFMASQLNAEKFIKTHRSYFVNLLKIDSLKADSLTVANIEIPVSNSKKMQLKQRLQKS